MSKRSGSVAVGIGSGPGHIGTVQASLGGSAGQSCLSRLVG